MTYSLLAVEDYLGLRRLLETLVNADPRFGVAHTAATAGQALALAERHRPDILTVDADLGRDDGLALVHTLRLLLPDAVIAVFSSAPYADAARSAQAGADAFVEKGTDPDALLDLLVRLAQERSALTLIELVDDVDREPRDEREHRDEQSGVEVLELHGEPSKSVGRS